MLHKQLEILNKNFISLVRITPTLLTYRYIDKNDKWSKFHAPKVTNYTLLSTK